MIGDVVIQDFSTHTLRYLFDHDFVEHVSKTGTATTLRRDSDNERGEQSEEPSLDLSQGISPEKNWHQEEPVGKCQRKDMQLG